MLVGRIKKDFNAHLLIDILTAYHEKLKEEGVKSQIFTVKGVTHGFFHLPGRIWIILLFS